MTLCTVVETFLHKEKQATVCVLAMDYQVFEEIGQGIHLYSL